MKVLVVDPEPNRLLDTGRILQGAGHQALGAGTGDECLRTAREKRPDLILLDTALPDVSGIDLVKKIKRDPQLASAYVVLLFADDTPSTIRARAIESGADGYLLRSLPKREFLARVEAMLRRKREEEALRASVQEWKATLDAISDPVYLVDMDHRILACNLALAKLLGKRPTEIVGRPCFELVHGAAEPIPACLNLRVQETRRRETLDVPVGERWLRVAVDPLLDEKGQFIGTVHLLSDTTESRQTQEALAKAQAALQAEAAARQQAEQALSQARAKLEKQAAENLAALARTGEALQSEAAQRKEAQQALSQERASWAEQADTYHRALAKASEALQAEAAARKQAEQERTQAEEALQGNRADHQRAKQALQTTTDLVYQWDIDSGQVEFFRDAHGKLYRDPIDSPTTVDQFLQIIHPQDRQRVEAAIERHLHSGEPLSETYRVLRDDGEVSYWMASGTALRDEDGQPRKWIGTATEVSTRVQAEQMQRMDAVAQLAGGVAQHLNEWLSVLLGSAEVALAQVGPSYAVHNELAAIQRTGRQVVALAAQLLAISGERLVQPQALDLNGFITGLIAVLRRLVGEDADLDVQLAPELKPVSADADALEQVLMNLTENARAAMPQGGTLRIETEEATIDDAYCQSHPAARPGAYARLTVANTGAGSSQATDAHLFEPFSSPAEPGTRDGLGLAEVYGIVKQHGGLIEARAQPDGGTAFEILLPVHETASPQATEDAEPE